MTPPKSVTSFGFLFSVTLLSRFHFQRHTIFKRCCIIRYSGWENPQRGRFEVLLHHPLSHPSLPAVLCIACQSESVWAPLPAALFLQKKTPFLSTVCFVFLCHFLKDTEHFIKFSQAFNHLSSGFYAPFQKFCCFQLLGHWIHPQFVEFHLYICSFMVFTVF